MAKDWSIERYSPAEAREWDEFVDRSRCATFLFKRPYMDYHAERFRDCSWIVRNGNAIVAMLPANIDEEGILHSHQGLTYGGWILPESHIDGADLLEIFSDAVEIWRKEGIRELDYKPLPWIYASLPSDEALYALFRLGAQQTEVNLSEAVYLPAGLRLNTLRRRNLKKCAEMPIEFFEFASDDEIRVFMHLLADCLHERHDTVPVHTAEEMIMLKRRFPEQIRIFGIEFGGELHAATCIYDCGRTVHAQYIATDAEGRRLNLLTPLFVRLMGENYADRQYFDFGISNEDHGRILNAGLLRQKFSFGATGIAYPRYSLKL